MIMPEEGYIDSKGVNLHWLDWGGAGGLELQVFDLHGVLFFIRSYIDGKTAL